MTRSSRVSTRPVDFIGDKIGHDKVDPIEAKLSGFVDSLGGDKPTQ